jgi:hypothetical protein
MIASFDIDTDIDDAANRERDRLRSLSEQKKNLKKKITAMPGRHADNKI